MKKIILMFITEKTEKHIAVSIFFFQYRAALTYSTVYQYMSWSIFFFLKKTNIDIYNIHI